jgi:hypothetical protein
MNKYKQSIAARGVGATALLAFILILAACGGNEPPVLVIPTPVDGTAAPSGEPTTIVGQPTADPSAIAPTPTLAGPQPTATLPPPPTVAPPLPTSTAGAQPTAGPSTAAPTATPVATVGGPIAAEGYRVAFVAANDTLNVRRQPNANAAIVTRLPSDATGIEVIGEGETIRGGSLWLPVETNAGDGWVNSRFLTEAVSRETFCADPAVADLLAQLRKAIEEEDGRLMRELIHPERGLRLRVNWWNEEVLVAGEDVQTIFRAQKKYEWGTEDGSGEEIRGSFSEIMLPRLERDLLGATVWGCDEGVFGGTAGATALPDGYEAVRYYSAHRAAPAEQELDWGTWLIGVERWEGQYYLSYLVHYRWEI